MSDRLPLTRPKLLRALEAMNHDLAELDAKVLISLDSAQDMELSDLRVAVANTSHKLATLTDLFRNGTP